MMNYNKFFSLCWLAASFIPSVSFGADETTQSRFLPQDIFELEYASDPQISFMVLSGLK